MNTIRFRRTKLRTVRSLVAVLLVCLCFVGLDIAQVSASTISFDSARECDSNAIIKCGALSTNQVVSTYTASSYAQKVYTYFGITKNDIQNLSTTARAGTVNKNGNVYINGNSTPVATNATSAGAQNIKGGTKVTTDDVTFYKRPLSAVVTSNSLDAFIVMHNNSFQFAIIASSGNPVIVSAVTSRPTAPISPTSPLATPPEALVNTGPSGTKIIGLFVLASMLGTLIAHRYQLSRLASGNSLP